MFSLLQQSRLFISCRVYAGKLTSTWTTYLTTSSFKYDINYNLSNCFTFLFQFKIEWVDVWNVIVFKVVVNANEQSRRKAEEGHFCLRVNPAGVDLNRTFLFFEIYNSSCNFRKNNFWIKIFKVIGIRIGVNRKLWTVKHTAALLPFPNLKYLESVVWAAN